ncbi:MAG: DUF2344 domain-containing protein [Lachnospiraceae bacterium]|nr:DUF2344 domain-containing protein [Lachnospiraceae bacterium]
MKIRIRFSKTGILRFIGHLDLMRTFQKAAARADLPLRFSEGFHPHPLMSFASPLSVGETSCGEYMDTELTASMAGTEILDRLNAALPEEIRCLSIRQLPDEEKKKNNNAMAIFGRADYAVRIRPPYDELLSASDPAAMISAYLAQPARNIIKKTKRSESNVDILPYIYELSFSDGTFTMQLNAGSKVNLKPEVVMEDLLAFSGINGFEKVFSEEVPRDLRLEIVRLDMLTDEGVSLSQTGVPLP